MVTKLLVQIMDDMDNDEGCGGNADWASLPFDNLIHIKGSLDDAVDSMMQLLASDSVIMSAQLNASVEEIMLSCVKPLGAWYSENEVEGGVYGRDLLVKALSNALALCDRVYARELNEMEGTDSDDEAEQDVPAPPLKQEPLFFLLPALAKIFNCRDDDECGRNESISEAVLKPSSSSSHPQITSIFLRFLTRQLRRRPRASIENIMWCADVLEGASKHVDLDEQVCHRL